MSKPVIRLRRGDNADLPDGGTVEGEPRFSLDTGQLFVDNGEENVEITPNAANVAAAGAVMVGGDLGTPSDGDLSNCTFPTLNQNTTGSAGSAATLTTGRTFRTNLASTSTASFDGSTDVTPGVTGTLPVGNGGSGATTLTGLLVGNGTSAFTAVSAPSGAVVGTSDTQTLTGKTISGSDNTLTNIGVSSIAATGTPSSGTYLRGDGSWDTPAGGGGEGGGDASTIVSESVDSEVTLFSGTSGKNLKRATSSGVALLTSGVLSTITAPSGTLVGTSDTQTLTGKTINGPDNTLTNIAIASLAATGIANSTTYLRGDGTWDTPAGGGGGGDASTNTASSVDSEVALFSSTGGKTLKRATGSGIALLTSGVLSTVTAPSGTLVGTTDAQTITNKDLSSGNTFPTFNQNTSGTAAGLSATLAVSSGGSGATTLTGILKGNGTSAFTAAAAGTDYVAPGGALGTPSSGTLTNCTFPTLNQNTTGSAATLTTARTFRTDLASTSTASFNGSANVAPGVTGTLAVGNGGSGATTLTGILVGNGTSPFTAITAPSGTLVGTTDAQTLTNKDLSSGTNTFPTLNQNTTGSAATLTTGRTFQTDLSSPSTASFNGSANVTPGVTGTLAVGNGGSGATTLTGILKGNGTSAFTTVTAPSGALVGTTDAQTITNKDLSSGTNTFPTLNQSTTGSAATLTTPRAFQTNLASTSSVTFDGSAANTHGVTGTLPVANGGSGATTLTGILKGNGTSAFTAVTAPTGALVGDADAQALTNKDLSSGTNTFPTFNQNTTGSAATLTTGRTFRTSLGSTSTATFDGSANVTPGVTGTLGVANGGTGVATLTGIVVASGTSDFTAVTAPSGTIVGTTDTQSLSNKTLTNPTITNYTESVVANGTVTTSKTLDLTSGTVQTATLTASTACTFTMPTATAGKSFTLYLKQAASTGNGTATFTGVKWGNAGAPTMTATAGKMDIFTFVADGTNWYGSYAQGYTP